MDLPVYDLQGIILGVAIPLMVSVCIIMLPLELDISSNVLSMTYLDHNVKKVAIVDWDVHHGDGTQHVFQK